MFLTADIVDGGMCKSEFVGNTYSKAQLTFVFELIFQFAGEIQLICKGILNTATEVKENVTIGCRARNFHSFILESRNVNLCF